MFLGRTVGSVLLPLAALVAIGSMLAASAGAQQQAWVQGDVRVNLRTGPSTGHRIIGAVETGDSLQLLERVEGWAHVQANGRSGWIPERFVAPEPPPALRVASLEAELGSLRQELDRTTREFEATREERERLAASEAERDAEISRLTAENLDLKAGERWPYLITGAAILAAGMLVGAILQRLGSRRTPPRIKL